MKRIRKLIPGVDRKLADQGRGQADARARRGARSCAAARASARSPSSPAATSSTAFRPRRCCARFRISTTACRPGCSIPNKLAPTYPESAITRPFPFNAYYPEDEAPEVDRPTFKLEVGGLIDNKEPWTLERLYALPQESQITRQICVEGWSAIGKWTGVRLSEFLRRLGADTRAKYVWFQCAEGYSNTIDMATALHPQTQLSFKFDDEILPRKYGFPMKCRMPTKLGFKNPKHVIGMHVTNKDLGGYWEDQGYNWFSGL